MALLFVFIVLTPPIFLALSTALGIWFTSEKFLRVTDAEHSRPFRIVKVDAQEVTLPCTRETLADGTYSITWQHHYAILGPIISHDARTVIRPVISTTVPLTVDIPVYWHPFIYCGDPQQTVGIDFEEVSLSSEVGELPAWFVPGKRSTWILFVHGFRGSREGGLRLLPVLQDMGFPALLMSYRNDKDAAKSSDRLYHLGDTEWQDIEAGVCYALAHGAKDVVLFGWSMGGCLVMTFMHRSLLASHVRSIVLDAPILDWEMVISTQMREYKAPNWFVKLVRWWIAHRLDLDFTRLNAIHNPRKHVVPTLLFHGTSDTLVPLQSSNLFVKAHPERVIYYCTKGADHVQSWNVEPQAYEERLKAFLMSPNAS